MLPYKLGWPYWVVAFRRQSDGILSVQVDLFDHLQWGFAWVVDEIDPESPVNFTGPFKVDPWATIGKRIVLNGLAKNFETFKQKSWYLDTSPDELTSLPRNFKRLSGEEFLGLQTAIGEANLGKIKSEFSEFRKLVFRRSLTGWNKIIPRLFNAWKKQYYFNWVPPRNAPILVLENSDPDMLANLSAKITCVLPYVVKIRDTEDVSVSRRDWSLKSIRKFRRSSALIEIQLFEAEDWRTLLESHPLSRFFLEADLHLVMDEVDIDEAVGRLLDWLERDSPVRLQERVLEFKS